MKVKVIGRRQSVRLLLLLSTALLALAAGAAGVSAATSPVSSPILPGHPTVALPAPAWGSAAADALGAQLPDVAKAYGWTAAQLTNRFRQDKSLNVDKNGYLFYIEAAPTASDLAAADAAAEATARATAPGAAAQALAPLADTFKLHSLPGAAHIVYLDFDGSTLHADGWTAAYNGGNDIVAPPYDTDGNPASFSDAELSAIQTAWQRVAEDYAPFNVDVTTEYLGEDYLTRSSSSDNLYGMRVLISPIASYVGNYGGIAYVGVFNAVGDYYKPALVFPEKLGSGNEKNVAEAASHENGHTLGLSHQGTTGGSAYYLGQGSGVTGWAPIMGAGYYQNLTQWSKGQYFNANNTEDEIAIMGTYGAPSRTDDVGGTTASAVLLPGSSSATASGIIGASTDADVFRVSWGAGPLTVSAAPAAFGPDLDILLDVLDANGNVMASNNPADLLTAGVSLTVAQGTYYIRVRGTGKGDPLVDGYSTYGSLGAYTVSATNVPSPPAAPTGLTATATSSTAIRLDWADNATNEMGYYVERWNAGTAAWDVIATLGANAATYTDINLSPSTSYSYYVGAYNDAGTSWSSGSVSASTPAVAPTPPSVTAVAPSSGPAAGGNAVAITGSQFTGATQVKFGSASAAFTVVDDGDISVTSVPAGAGAVDVTVTSPAGTSATSAADLYTYMPPPAAPTGLTASGTSSSTILVGWTDNATTETGYRVYRWNAGTSTWDLVTTTAANATSYTDTGRSPGTTYTYRVASFNLYGETSSSGSVSATTLSTSTRYDQTNINIVKTGTWTNYSATGAYSGSYGRSSTSGASATIYFTGSRLDWIATKGSTGGIADVYVDGTKVATINLTATSTGYQQMVWSSGTLSSNGAHNVRIVRSTSSAGGRYLTLDAFDIWGTIATPPITLTRYDQKDTSIVRTGTWTNYSATAAYLGSYGRSSSSGASATIYFTGTRLDWIAMKGSTTGAADVYLDGTKVTTITLTATTTAYQVNVWSSGTLTYGAHNVRIVRVSTGSSKFVTLDAVDIWGWITTKP